MDTEELSKEQRILRMMRKTLANVVKDATPLGGRPNPLKDSTIQEIKDCLSKVKDSAAYTGVVVTTQFAINNAIERVLSIFLSSYFGATKPA